MNRSHESSHEQCSAGKFIDGVPTRCYLDKGHKGMHEYHKGVWF